MRRSKMKKITFLVSGNGGTLKCVYYAIKKFNSPLKISKVIADRECGAITFAQKKDIPSEIISYTSKDDAALIECLKKEQPDIVITNIHKILTKNVLQSINGSFINLHYSLLPAFSGLIGMKTVEEAKKQNCQFLGATCHQVDEKLDGGRILCQGVFPVNWTEPDAEINDRLFRVACTTLLNVLLEDDKEKNIPNSRTFILNPKPKFNIQKLNMQFWNLVKEKE